MTGEERTDFARIEADIAEIHSEFGIQELAFDPMHAPMLIDRIQDSGIKCIEIRPSVVNFSDPMKVLEAMILEGEITHDGNPCMDWMVSNVVTKEDPRDNVYPRKERPESKIDGPVAMIMAMNRAQAGEEEFVYHTESFLVV